MANSLMVQNKARMPMTFIVLRDPPDFMCEDMTPPYNGAIHTCRMVRPPWTHHPGS